MRSRHDLAPGGLPVSLAELGVCAVLLDRIRKVHVIAHERLATDHVPRKVHVVRQLRLHHERARVVKKILEPAQLGDNLRDAHCACLHRAQPDALAVRGVDPAVRKVV